MALELILTGTIARLRQGRFQNEQAVSQGIVLPILRELGWDIFDTTLVWPEYQTGELESARGRGVRAATRADCYKRQQHLVGLGFAVCYPPSKPAEFIRLENRNSRNAYHSD